MPDRTGRALGTLDAAIYFENASGHIVLPGIDIGEGPASARRVYEQRFKHQGYEWREADTLHAVQRLQKRLIEQEEKVLKNQGHVDEERRRKAHAEINGRLRQRMASSDCDPWERDFIALWLQNRDDKQKEFTQRFTERNQYLWAAEMDTSTKVQDRMGSD